MHEKDAVQSLFQHFTFKLTFTFSFHHITRINLYKMYTSGDTHLLFVNYDAFTCSKITLKTVHLTKRVDC